MRAEIGRTGDEPSEHQLVHRAKQRLERRVERRCQAKKEVHGRDVAHKMGSVCVAASSQARQLCLGQGHLSKATLRVTLRVTLTSSCKALRAKSNAKANTYRNM